LNIILSFLRVEFTHDLLEGEISGEAQDQLSGLVQQLDPTISAFVDARDAEKPSRQPRKS
ncbi:hypothetical protein DEE96_38795, partial [Burkholderia cepacia]|uniref:hypothetical protein n=1 Tax=Burkholderia cepacia TaxID=292 RepID=UPI0015FED33C